MDTFPYFMHKFGVPVSFEKNGPTIRAEFAAYAALGTKTEYTPNLMQVMY